MTTDNKTLFMSGAQLRPLGVAVLYALLARAALTCLSENGVSSVIWLPGGMALAVLLLGGKRYAVSVFLGAFLAYVMTGNVTVVMAAGIAAGCTLGALLGAWLLTREGRFSLDLISLSDYLRLTFLAGGIVSIISALNGSTLLFAFGHIPADAYFHNLALWWMGDMLGIVLFAPLPLIWRQMPEWLELKRLPEVVLIFGTMLFFGQVVFFGWLHDSLGMIARGYWMFLFIAVVAIRMGSHGVIAALLITAVQALLGTLQGVGFFAGDAALTNYWLYMMILSTVGMMLSTYFAERRRAVEDLQRFFNLAPDLMCIASTDGHFLRVNAMWQQALGYTEREIMSTPFLDFIHPDDKDATVKEVERQMQEHATIQFVNRYRCKDGSYRWLEWAATPSDNNKQLYGCARDTTERRLAEDERERMKVEAMEARTLLQAVLDSTPDWVFAKDVNHCFLFVNKSFAEAQSLTPQDMIGRPDTDFWSDDLCRGDQVRGIRGFHADDDAAMAGNLTHNLNDPATLANGELRFFDTLKMPLHDTSGHCYGVLAYARDVTDRKAAESQLRELNEHLEERVMQRTQELDQAKQVAESSNRIKSEFLANMSHEIRTPLNSVLGMTQLVLNSETDKVNRDYLQKILFSGEHLLGIIDDILDFSKLDAGKLKIDRVDFNLNRVLENINNLIAGRAAAKGLELVFDIDDDLCTNLRGDPLRLVQVLVNYATNAVKFTEKGRIVIRARKIEENEADCVVRFEVQDSGIGMDEAEKASLFQPFQQLDNSATRQYEGAGLGLAICKRLAEMMPDGEVGVDSSTGKGSTFWFMVRLEKADQSFPMERRAKNRTEPENVVADTQFMQAAIPGARILLVEDHPLNQQVATAFIEKTGATVCVAQNGKEAIEMLGNSKFDCVLMDVQMPVMDGLEATRLIRANPALAGIPVIALTANASDENRQRCLAAGMNDFIGKPFRYQAFCNVIVKWLGCSADVPQAAAEPENDTAIIDLAALSRICGTDDKQTMQELTRKFLASAMQDMKEIEAALKDGDLASLGRLGHRINGAARMVGAAELADLCRILEIDSRDGESIEQLQDIVNHMHRSLESMGKAWVKG